MNRRSKGELRLGVIGSGFAARTLVAAANKSSLVREIRVAGGSRVGSLCSAYGVVPAPGVEQLLDTVDAVVVATPHDTHAEYVRAALSRGLDVLCEKPFVTDVAEGAELIKIAVEGKCALSVNHFQRYRLPNAAVAELLHREGTPTVLAGQARLVESPPDRRWQRTPYNKGFLLGYGVHVVDLLLWWLGEPVTQVSARSLLDEAGIERCTTASLLFNSGTTISLSTSDLGYEPAGPHQPCRAVLQCELLTTNGLIIVDSYSRAAIHTEDGARTLAAIEAWQDFHSPIRLDAYYKAFQQFAKSCLDRSTPELAASTALEAVRVCAAMGESAAAEGAVKCVSRQSVRS